jgi:hypothetical protein
LRLVYAGTIRRSFRRTAAGKLAGGGRVDPNPPAGGSDDHPLQKLGPPSGAARPANARGELIRSCTVRSWTCRIRLCGGFPYRPTIGGACGINRLSPIERAIVRRACEKCPDLADLRQPIFEGVFAHSYKRCPPAFFTRVASWWKPSAAFFRSFPRKRESRATCLRCLSGSPLSRGRADVAPHNRDALYPNVTRSV